MAVVLHISVQPKVYESMERLEYVRNNPHRFEQQTIPIVVCYLKLFIEFALQIISLLNFIRYDDALEVVFNYLALEVIIQLDEIYYESVNSALKERLEDRDFEITIDNLEASPETDKELTTVSKILLFPLRVIREAYELLYFHVFPYTMFVFIYVYKFGWQALTSNSRLEFERINAK